MTRRIDAYRHALTDLAAIEPTIAAAQARLWDARSPLPGAASYDGPTVSGGSSSSPTERHALNGDPTQRDRDAFDKALRHLTTQAAVLRRLVDAWTPHAPSARDRAQVERLNAPDDGCEHHATAGIYELSTHTGTVAGNLTVPMRLCEFCYRETYRKGKLPRGEVLVDRHHKGKDPMVPA